MIVGLDMGGTHLDGIIIKDEQVIRTIKNPTDREDLFTSIWTSLEELVEDIDKSEIQRINLSTTVSTNAIIEDKISKVGMLIQSGPGVKNDFSACRGENQFLGGYVDHRGVVVEDIDPGEIKKAGEIFKQAGVESLALVSKFSTRNPKNEEKMAEILAKDFDRITLGHRMSGELNFPRRFFTSYLNSAVDLTFKEFASNIKESLRKEGIDAPIFILKADGGTMDLETAEARPVETILSGPAASFMGMTSLLETKGDALLLDIGGTTTDIFFLADGAQLFEGSGARIAEYNTLVRAIYSVSIGLGGDSAIRLEDGEVKIGPIREGRPYALGGPKATPTDAMIYLGEIEVEEDKKSRAGRAMDKLAGELEMDAEEVSNLILDRMAELIKIKTDELLEEINSKPVYTVKEFLEDKKLKPENINIIGGPAKVLKSRLEARYKLPVRYPENYQVANAIGAALAKPTVEISLLADTAQKILTVSDLGIYEKISSDYSLEDAKKRARELLEDAVRSMGAEEDSIESEIIEASSFNMVGGFFTTGKNIRVRAQIKPGHIGKLRSEVKDES